MLSRQNRYRKSHRLASFIMLLLWVAALGLIALNRQNIIDWWRLRNYQAPAAVAQLASQDTMTSYGRKIFYVNSPQIDSKASFGSICPNDGGEQTIVLGCYHSDQAGVFLLMVTDQRLNGVQQVTAAHEMLHAAYDRLNPKERDRVNGLLEDYYKHHLHDERILKTIEAYKKSEPHDVVNEMHSVFGTEVADLPAPLEQYYQRYFANRSQVAAFAAQYQSEFTSRQDAVTRADTRLAQLKTQIDGSEADLKTKQAAISSQQDALFNLRSSGNIAAYNAGVPAYNKLVDNYNTQIDQVKSLISQYNQLVASRNTVALEEDQLIKELSPTNIKPINN